MTDLISRAEAIEAVESVNKNYSNEKLGYVRGLIKNRLKALPSAELPNGDLISRTDAMNKCKNAENELTDEAERKGVRVARFIIGEMPSADAVQGEWEFVDNEIFAGEYFCSICGKRAEVDLYGEWILSNFCPSCGARMKGGAE